MIALTAAVVAISAPVAIDVNTWFQGFGAHPKEGPLTVIASEITVNRHGYAESCQSRVLVGDPNWSPFTCELIKSRGQFRPARIEGHATYGVYRLRIAWVQRGPPPPGTPVWDFEVPVGRDLPAIKLPALQKIQFLVDATGRIQGCDAAGKWEHPESAALACEQLPGKVLVRAAVSRAGKPVESVQDAAVRFVP